MNIVFLVTLVTTSMLGIASKNIRINSTESQNVLVSAEKKLNIIVLESLLA